LSSVSTSPDGDRKAAVRRRLWLLGAGLAVLIAALAFFASQQGGGGSAGGPLNAIAEAAVKTQDAGGGRAVMRGSVVKPGHPEPLAVTGRMVYTADAMGRGTMNVSDPDSEDSVKLDMVEDGTEVYMRSDRFDGLPEGKEWMAIDLALGDELDISPPASVDAKGELGVLEEVTGDVRKVGKEAVRGVPTTRYRTSLSVSETAEQLRAEGGDESASLVEKKGSPMQLEVWIDAEELVRRMRVVQSIPGEDGAGPTSTDMRIDFFDFGLEPEIDVPDSDEVFDATSLVREQAAGSDDE
jgi:hypothetical protein